MQVTQAGIQQGVVYIIRIALLNLFLNEIVYGQTCSGTSAYEDCLSCSTLVVCSQTSTEPLGTLECGSGLACSVTSTNADCVDANSLTTKTCGCSYGGSLVSGTFEDPHDTSSYVECDQGVPNYMSCTEENEVFNGPTGQCVSCPGGTAEKVPIANSCSNYLDCDVAGVGEIKDCNSNKVFDYESQKCIDPAYTCSLSNIIEAEPLKCNVYHTCIASKDHLSCCPYGQRFDDNSKTCQQFSEANCGRTFINNCIDAQYENDHCYLCSMSEEGDTFSTYLGHECQTVYYECVSNGTDIVATVRYCDEGSVYVESTNMCEYIEAHPEC